MLSLDLFFITSIFSHKCLRRSLIVCENTLGPCPLSNRMHKSQYLFLRLFYVCFSISIGLVIGSSGAVTVRIGPKSDAYGFRSGFRTNPKCVEIISGLVLGTKQTYQCAFPSTGQFLTIESSDTATGQLQLCTVELITA